MIKEILNGIKVFFVFFSILFILNLLEIRIFADSLYSAEMMGLGILFFIINVMFARL